MSALLPQESPRAGYTLPVFACASAIAALQWLQDNTTERASVAVNLVEPAETAVVPIAQVARLSDTMAIAITHSDPGDNLDLTRNTPVWAVVELAERQSREPKSEPQLVLEGGEGVGRSLSTDQPAIYAYARRLMEANVLPLLELGAIARVKIILPEGRALAQRTSNAAFGVVDGLSLLGTTGIAQPLSAPGQLTEFRDGLVAKAQTFHTLVFCVGENGLDLATHMGVPSDRLIKTANWLGPLLAEAGLQGLQQILLFGYHGKLLKLAGGIFHTHHHVADGRQEILAAHCANQGMPTAAVQMVLASATAEAGLQHLCQMDVEQGTQWVEQVYGAIAQAIDTRTQRYIHAHSDRTVQVGTVLFGRDRQILIQSQTGSAILSQFC
ncbi:cobalt-precorrin-5B (C(1))-methyltransferase CbiD [Leptolyngbya sp. AN02str]|uniref:cobalt-precorrin-5B (C(1))-methyltransferase CbiD n=1 Tax=Leptolyngbya sp. AN02str TaxID=3423363 RepID=UPI003D30F8AD